MLARIQLARARRLNQKLADKPAHARELDDAVHAWERVVARQPEDWWSAMGLAEALLRRGNRTGSVADLRAARERFAHAGAKEDRPLARAGEALASCAIGWLERDAATLRDAIARCAALRRDPRASVDAVAQTLLAEWQAAARLAHLTRDPRDAHMADELARKAEGMMGEPVGRLRGDPRFLHL